MAIYDNYNIRFNTANNTLEMNIGNETWIPVPESGGSAITGLTADVTATGPGNVPATLATVNSNVGAFTNANITVDGKGRITAAASGSGGSSTVKSYNFTTTGITTSSTSFVATNLLGNFTLSNAAHRVQITVAGSLEQDTGGVSSILTIYQDGVDLSDGSGFSLSQGIPNISILIVTSPGNTATHTYTVYAKNSGGTGVLTFPDGPQATMLIEEIL